MRVLAISGSLRRDSYNTALLRAAVELAPDDVDVELYAGLGALPPYDQDADVEPADAEVARLRAAIDGADAVLFATPEYNGSIPGVLKNAIDWASRPKGEAPLQNKTVAIVGASTGQFGGMWAQADLRKVLGIAGARVVGEGLPVARAHEQLDPIDETLRNRLRDVVDTLVVAAEPEPVAA